MNNQDSHCRCGTDGEQVMAPRSLARSPCNDAGLFAIFNRVDETSRTFLYLPLQATKGIGIVLMLGLPVTIVGAALLIAQAIARWMTYVVYRNSAACR
jgi:hypothetical protein